MIEVPYICIVRVNRKNGKDGVEQQEERWQALRASDLMIGQVLDISGLSLHEASRAILKAGQARRLERVAVESLAGLADNPREAVALAAAVINSGARLFLVSYAVGGARLIEVDRTLMQAIAEYTDEFKTVNGDEVLFVAGYAKQLISLENLLYHLSALEESLKTTPADLPPDQVAAEIRRIALLIRVMQKQVRQTISVN